MENGNLPVLSPLDSTCIDLIELRRFPKIATPTEGGIPAVLRSWSLRLQRLQIQVVGFSSKNVIAFVNFKLIEVPLKQILVKMVKS